jgi:hypothetical protein
MKVLLGYSNDTVFREHMGFLVLIEAVMKSSIFWDAMPCSLLKVN